MPSTASATDQLAALQLAAAAAAAADAAAVAPAAAAKANIRCFTEAAPDATLFFQVIDLGQQVYVWVSVGGAKFSNLYLAIQSRMDPVPSVATLLPDAASGGAAGMAQRLARRVGRPVVCSCNMPANAEVLQVFAERRLCQELESMGLTAGSSSKAAGAAAAGAVEAAAAAASLPCAENV
ncbi:hypothetical protein OEZ86_008134 [Tetradesmus obliquus]|nr:hypothetical protein OEZ86_008134 [Tetradesmus obliquus]